MIRMNSNSTALPCLPVGLFCCGRTFILAVFFIGWGLLAGLNLAAAEITAATNSVPPTKFGATAVATHATPRFNVRSYAIEDKLLVFTNTLDHVFASFGTNLSLKEINVRAYSIHDSMLLFTNPLTPVFAKYTGTNISRDEIVQAAAVLQNEYRERGYPGVSVSISEKQIINGIVTLNVFHGVTPQILMSGTRYINSSNGVAVAVNLMGATITNTALALADTNSTPATATNAVPRFEVKTYLIAGNSVLAPETIKASVFPHMGTNVMVSDIVDAALDLQKAYRNRGYPTVNVTIPQQKITNGLVKLQVFEGRLSDIIVANNHYFSSNNVMRALPDIHTNQLLNGPIFQAELNQANANQDRQIYPTIEPGPVENSTLLRLTVKDQLPLHGKVEFNNESSPGTPGLRVNTSAVYNNLWQLEHAFGVQYGFTPENYQPFNGWDGYEEPMVTSFSTFYRMPLWNPEPIEQIIASNPDNFGYSEASRQFRLPPPSGQASLTIFASHATIDTGLTTLSQRDILSVPGVISISEKDVQVDLTKNNDIGTRLNVPLQTTADFHSGFSTGFDYKNYALTSNKTNLFLFTLITQDEFGNPQPPVTSTVASPVPTTDSTLNYIPLALGYDAAWRLPRATIAFGLAGSVNAWYSGSDRDIKKLANSTEATGYWLTLDPNLMVDFTVYTNWVLSLHANGQWADEPLISNEQFGAGGVSSVRGYQEGAVFGDTGWHVSLEQKTPPHVVGTVYGHTPLTIRGSVYMDYADTYLLDPQGRQASTGLWGTGFGIVGSVGSHWEARFLFSVPLLTASTTTKFEPYFNFGLTGQF
jgi:hemolysin activation/secretion protein